MSELRPGILFLSRWYPNRYDPMPGLFVKYQAEAVSAFCDVAVVSVHEDHKSGEKYEAEISRENGILAVRVYYRTTNLHIPLITGLLKMWGFFMAYRKGLQKLSAFPVDMVHVHVLTRVGVIACLHRILTGNPYIITEHWSRYYHGNIGFHGIFRKMITRFVVKRSAMLISVSGMLKNALIGNKLNHPLHVILPNPVSPLFLKDHPDIPRKRKKQIIHVSCFDDQSKNITGFLYVIQKIGKVRSDFEVLLVGDGPDFIRISEEAEGMGLLEENLVSFCGLIENDELVKIMRAADFLVLSSNYETFGSVVIESLVCGTPVVATNVGVVPEIVDKTNGMIVEPGDLQSLERAILEMLDQCRTYNREIIRRQVIERYSSDRIGKELFDIYRNVLSR